MHGAPQAYAARTGGDTNIPTIQREMRLGGVAVGLYIEHSVGTVYIPSPDEMQCRLRAPVGAIEVECVLTNFAVRTDEPLLVDICQITFPPRVAREIEHVPDECAPEVRSLLQCSPRGLVVEILVFLGVRPAMRGDRATVGIVAVL